MRNKPSARILVWILTLALIMTFVIPAGSIFAESPTGNIYYLATNGLDTNPGTKDAPFGTLLHAFQQLASGDTLIIREGTYKGYLQVIEKNNVTIKNYEGENVTIENGPVNVGYVFYAGSSSNVLISGLKFYLNEAGNNGNIAYIDTCTNLKITNCELTSGEGGIITRYGCSNLEISNNTFRNLGWALGGVLLWNASNCKIFNNVFDNTDFSVNLWGSESIQNQIYNNTFGSEYCDVAAQSISGIAHDNVFKNNIFGSAIQNQNLINPDSPVKNFMALNVFDNNCYNNTTFTGGVITTDGLTLEQVKAQGVEAAGFMGDPKFLNPATEEYQIGRGSECHDAGTDTLVPPVDKLGNTRTGAVDLGAYIYSDRVNYYVAADGSDTNAGTDAAPFKTIAHAIDAMQAGDYLFVKAGTYPEGISISGKTGLTVKNYQADQPVISQLVNIQDSQNVAVSGFALKSSVTIGNSKNAKVSNMNVNGGHIVVVPGSGACTDGYEISSCLIHGFQGEGAILVYNGKNGNITNNVIYNNAYQGILLEGGECINNSVYNNTLYNNGCDLLLVYAPSIGNPANNTFRNNIFSNGLQLGDKRFFANHTFDYNCYNSANLTDCIGLANVYNDAGEYVETIYPSLETLKADGIEANGFAGKPSFINPSIDDFRLRKTSDCVGKGTAAGAPLYDLNGFHRSEPYDLGAYKFTGAVNDYYVSTDGDDNNPGTPEAPYRTIQHAINAMAPGETAYVKGGVYNESLVIDNKAGTETDKFKILPVGSGEVILDSNNTGENAITISGGSSFWNIEGLSIRNYTNNEIRISGSSGIKLSKINMADTAGNALYAEDANNCTLDGVKISNAGINGISLKNSANWVINKAYVSKASEAAMSLDASSGSKVKTSLFTNSKTGIVAIDSDNLVIYNNDFFGNSQSDMKLDQLSTGSSVKNNIFGSAGSNFTLEIADINNDFDYNCYNKASGDAAINYTSKISLNDFKALGKEANGIQADPMFTDPANGDYLLKPYSPCADKGISDSNTPAAGYDGYSFETPADMGAMFSPYSMKTYYVATDGSDTNDGSIEHPWKTVRKGMETMKQSDVLYIRGGTYSERVNLYDKIGRPSAYFTVKNYNGEKVIMDSGFTEDVGIKFSNCSYWKIDGLKFRAYTGAAIWSTAGSSYITMENLEIWDIDNPTFHISGTEGILSDGDYHTLRNCYIHDIGQTLCERADNGVYIGYGSDHWIIDSNRFENIPGGGINLYGKPTGGDYSVITNNVVVNSMFGMVLTMCKGLFISNNTLVNNWGADIYTDWWINDSVIQNNILYNDMAADAKVRVEDKEKQGSTKFIGINPVPILIQYEEVNNNIFRNNMVYSKNFGNRVMDIATIKPMEEYLKTQTLNTFENYYYGDPLLVNPANGDYRLQDSSPCIDAGVAEGAPAVDITGTARTYAPDLGAYENVNTSIWAIENAVNYYIAKGELKGALSEQLTNDAAQALHQYKKGDFDKAAKHIGDLLSHLNNKALAKLVSESAKADLNKQAKNLIDLLKLK